MENRKEFIVNEDEIGLRLDAFLASKIEGKSRGYCQKMIDEKLVFVNEKIQRIFPKF